jgi:hypothetical protein
MSTPVILLVGAVVAFLLVRVALAVGDGMRVHGPLGRR